MLKKIEEHFEEALLVLLMGSMSVLIFVQIVMRYVFQASLSWSEELARYLFVWLSYVGVAYAVKKGAHIRVDAFTSLMPVRLQKRVLIVAECAFLFFALMVVSEGFALSMKIFRFGQFSPALGIPMGYVYLAPVVGFTLVVLRLVQALVRAVKDLKEGCPQ